MRLERGSREASKPLPGGAAPCALLGPGYLLPIKWPVTASKKWLPYVLEPSPLSVNRTMQWVLELPGRGQILGRVVLPCPA
jgi:hypothetical protein